MDKKDKKRQAQEYVRLTKKISRVLKRFTPIDPADEYSIGDDYDLVLPKIVSLLLRDPDRDELLRIIEQTRRELDVSPDLEKDEKAVDAVMKSALTGAPPPMPKLAFRLDLRNDIGQIESYIVKRVRDFDSKLNHGPGNSNTVSQIVIGFQCSQAGWLALVFDTRPFPTSDGEWTAHLENVPLLKQDNWIKAGAANFRGPIEIINTLGIEQKYPEQQAELTWQLGDMIRDLAVDARNRGVFSDLPIAPACEILVEDFDGEYYWPNHENPGSLNRVIV